MERYGGGRFRSPVPIRAALVARELRRSRGEPQEHQHAQQPNHDGSPGICHGADRSWALLVVRCWLCAGTSLLPGSDGKKGFRGRRAGAFEEVHGGRFGVGENQSGGCVVVSDLDVAKENKSGSRVVFKQGPGRVTSKQCGSGRDGGSIGLVPGSGQRAPRSGHKKPC